MDELYLEYINNPETLWTAVLGAIYGTNWWQFHNPLQMNGSFKCELPKCKDELITKKRVAVLKADIEQVEIVIIARTTIIRSFMNAEYATSALLHRGLNPFNRAPLDIKEISASAPEEVQREKERVGQIRGIESRSDVHARAAPSQQNFLEVGSACLIPGGPGAAAGTNAQAAQ